MKKKIIISSALIVLLALVFYIIFEFVFSPPKQVNGYCPFCDRKVIEYQKYYEDETAIGLCTHRPVSEGHCLIIPKRHVERFEQLSQEEYLAIGELIKKTHIAAVKVLNADNYILLQKNGKNVGQTVAHLHFHYIPRKAGDKCIFGFFLKFVVNPLRSPIPQKEMNAITSAFEQAL